MGGPSLARVLGTSKSDSQKTVSKQWLYRQLPPGGSAKQSENRQQPRGRIPEQSENSRQYSQKKTDRIKDDFGDSPPLTILTLS